MAKAAQLDAALLQESGYGIEWTRREPALHALSASHDGEATKLEWVADSDYRFFPTLRDELFGYLLHPIDLATNKVAAAYGRREPRDIVDLLTSHERILPVGALVWAAADKAPGFTPEGMINEIRRLARYTEADFRDLVSDAPVDAAATMTRLREILAEADAFDFPAIQEKQSHLVRRHAPDVQPEPDRFRRTEGSGGVNGRVVRKSAARCSSAMGKAQMARVSLARGSCVNLWILASNRWRSGASNR